MALRDLGKPDQDQPLVERALSITEAAYGPNYPPFSLVSGGSGGM
ncbi:MAG: tetratricopeptide repeat protein [Pseudonocardiaceae bacterium]